MARNLPPLNHLRAVEAVARRGSFRDGADELCVTPAAVSHQVRALEDRLGARLLDRGPRGVRPTPEAEALIGEIGAALDRMDAALGALDAARMAGRLRLSAAPFLANRWLLPRLDRFRAEAPELEIELTLAFETVDLEDGGLDGALRYGTGPWPGLEAIGIHRDRLGPVCAPTAIAGASPPLALADLAALPLHGARGFADDWPAWFAAAGLDGPPPAPRLHESRAFAFDSALSGHGLCLADIRMTAADEAAGRLVRPHPVTVERPQGLHLVVPRGRGSDPRIARFAAWLRDEAAAGAAG